ncbi:DinB family protein [Neobacillus mesonae]|uniref:DinB family protein n=1 Tax=Neobacillus mesonae TaxID=1193713 RepID=UPI00203C143E|nr:DinB family protein [Neobacillus mesonae]MCM3569720.1 DinB family protein [Neobacillus mesonae]
MLQRPSENEYPKYYLPYVKLVPEGNIVTILKENLESVIGLFEGISEENALFRYAENKWSIKEVLGHITDTERIMSYRLMRAGRGDQTELAGFDENLYVQGAKSNQLLLKDLLEDFIAARNATIRLIRNMPEDAWTNIGFANKSELTTRAIAYIIAGHENHHRNIVKDRYLTKL